MIYSCTENGILVRVRLSPNSSSCRLNGIFTDAEGVDFLKIAVVNVPEKGKANKELLSYISKKLGISKTQCSIVSGELDRYKKIEIAGDADILIQRIEQWISGEKNGSTNN